MQLQDFLDDPSTKCDAHRVEAQILAAFTWLQVPVTSVSWSNDGQHIAAGAEDGNVIVWAAETGEVLLGYAHAGAAAAVAFSPGWPTLASASAGELALWTPASHMVFKDVVRRHRTNCPGPCLQHSAALKALWLQTGAGIAATAGSTEVRSSEELHSNSPKSCWKA